MASRIDNQRACIRVYVFESDPDAAHESLRKWRQVDAVLVNGLLASVDEVQSLTRKRLIVEDRRQDLDDLGMSPQAASRLAVLEEFLDSLAFVFVLENSRANQKSQISIDPFALLPRHKTTENQITLAQEVPQMGLVRRRELVSLDDAGNSFFGIGTLEPGHVCCAVEGKIR